MNIVFVQILFMLKSIDFLSALLTFTQCFIITILTSNTRKLELKNEPLMSI